MFDREDYQNACARLTLGTEKLEEMIAMTENTKKKKVLSRPLRVALIAAACVAALGVTAFAAAPAIQNLFTSYVVTIKDGEDLEVVVPPSIETYSEDGHNYLVVNGETTDITEALDKDGQFVLQDESGHEIKVTEDGWISVSGGGDVDFSFKSAAGEDFKADGAYVITGDDWADREVTTGFYHAVTDTDGVTTGSYKVATEDEITEITGATDVTDALEEYSQSIAQSADGSQPADGQVKINWINADGSEELTEVEAETGTYNVITGQNGAVEVSLIQP